jgi:hypothetical protein
MDACHFIIMFIECEIDVFFSPRSFDRYFLF